jgi:hypothetical protein
MLQELLPRVNVLQGQVGWGWVPWFYKRRTVLFILFLAQAQRVLGVTFFGCSHLKQTQTSSGDNLYCSPRPNYNRNPAFKSALRYSKIPPPCAAEHVPPGVDILVRGSPI